MNARDVLLDVDECTDAWNDTKEIEVVESNPIGMTVLLQQSDEFEGNVFTYEVRTALDEFGIAHTKDDLTSDAFREEIKHANT